MHQRGFTPHVSSHQGLALLEVLLALALSIATLLALLPLLTHSLDSSHQALTTVLAHQAQTNQALEARLTQTASAEAQ